MAASFPVAETLEDLAFLDETGVGANDAAKRIGFASAHAMERWLDRQDEYDLWLRFKHRDPEGAHPSGRDRKKRRLMSIQTQQPDAIAALITEAQQSTRARTRKRADKISDLVADLRGILAAERDEDQRRETARKEIEKLERQLAEAKQKLRGGVSSSITVGSGISAADLRAWAERNGVECPAKGRVPATVREAYEEAAEEAAS